MSASQASRSMYIILVLKGLPSVAGKTAVLPCRTFKSFFGGAGSVEQCVPSGGRGFRHCPAEALAVPNGRLGKGLPTQIGRQYGKGPSLSPH